MPQHDHDHHKHDHDDHQHGHDHGHDHGAPGGHGGNKGHAGESHEGHSHGPPATQSKLFWALFFTGGCMVIETIGGIMSGSLALLADAAHMLTDSASLAMSYAAVRVALRPATDRMSYGHHRWQVLAAFVNGIALVLLAVWILVEGAQRLMAGTQVNGSMVASIAVLGLLANIGAFLVLSRGEANLNVRSALAHVIGDVMASGAALVAGLVIYFTGWMPVDPLLSGVVAFLMIRSGWRITHESAQILLEASPTALDFKQVEQKLLEKVPQLEGIHHLHSWMLTDELLIVTLHARLKEGADPDACIGEITHELERSFRVGHATIQVERTGCVVIEGDRCAAEPQPVMPQALPKS